MRFCIELPVELTRHCLVIPKGQKIHSLARRASKESSANTSSKRQRVNPDRVPVSIERQCVEFRFRYARSHHGYASRDFFCRDHLCIKAGRMSSSRLVGLFCLIAAFASTASSEEHWPEHRGPNRNYHLKTKTDYPTNWSVAKGENVRWRMPLPETGHSGIAIWGDRLFLTCFRKLTPEDIGPKGTWVSESRGYCLSAETGEILWSWIAWPGRSDRGGTGGRRLPAGFASRLPWPSG